MRRKIYIIFMWVLLTSIMLFYCLGVFGGCTKKYDVVLIIQRGILSNTGRIYLYDKTWIFPPDIDELHIVHKYDGERYKYVFSAYNVPKHPQYNRMLVPTDVDYDSKLYKDGTLMDNSIVQEQGKYCLKVSLYAADDFDCKPRTVMLYINVE